MQVMALVLVLLQQQMAVMVEHQVVRLELADFLGAKVVME
jgi:hypothetical protein